MRPVFVNIVYFVLALQSQLVNAFPTIEKPGVVERSENLKLQRELENIALRAEEKRLLFDSLTTPIEGMA